MDDDGLLARIRAGDNDALGSLLERHREHLLWRITRLHGVSAQDAEDILQEVHRRCIAQRFRLQPGVRRYLQRIAENVCIDHHRRRVSEARTVQEALRNAGGAPVDRVALRIDAQSVLGRLKERCRELITKVLLEERTHDEYARESGTPRGTVGTTMTRCLEYARRLVVRSRKDDRWEP